MEDRPLTVKDALHTAADLATDLERWFLVARQGNGFVARDQADPDAVNILSVWSFDTPGEPIAWPNDAQRWAISPARHILTIDA